MDNLFDRFNATTESVQPHTDILNGSPLKLNDVSAEKHREEEKTQSCVIVDKQDGGKETSMQKASGTREDRPSSFVIPKKKRHKTDVLLDVKMSSRDFQHEVLPAITKSYRQPQSCARFNYDQVQLVQNPYLTDAYMEKRRELRGYGYVEKELSDSFAFLCMDMENEEEINKICKEGLHIGNSVDSCLGHPKMGVHLCKHADILKPVGLHSGYTGHIIVFKVMKGKIKSVMENRNGSCLEPTPNHDCHVSSTTGNDLGSLNQRDLYESTQLYLYEYGEENVQDVPRNVCPVAVVRFTYNEIKDVKSPDISSPKFLVRSPLSVKAIQSSTQAKDKSSEQKFVVWSGHLTVKGLYACSVEMVSKAGPSKPSRIGKGINITHKMPIAQARKKYLQKVTSISRQQEGFCNGYYVNVCELHPVKPEGKSHFQKVMNYLGKHNCVAIRKLEKDVVLLLLTASELTFQLGLTKPHQYPVILYSIFLSRTSRKHGAVQTDPLVQPVAPTTLPPSQDPHRDKTIPLHISLPPSQSSPHLSDSTKHSTLASPSHTYPSSVCVMPPPPSPTKGMRAAPRVSPVVGASPPKRWEVSSPPPPLNIPAFYPSLPLSPHAPPVIAPTSPIQGLRSPIHPPLSPLNHWVLIPPPPPPSTPPPPPTVPLQGQTPQSPHIAPSTRDMVCPYSPITSPITHPLSPSQPLQYCPPISRPVHLSGVHKDPHDSPRDPRFSTDYPRSPRDQHVRDPRHGFISPVPIHPVLEGEKSPVLKGPLTSSPQHPTQPPPKLQTPPPSPRYELEGTRFESPRHFSKYPPKTSLLFSDQMKTEFQKQAKRLEEMLAQRVRNKTQTSTKQSNCHFSMSSDSESEMSDTEVNRIVRQLAVPTDESMDTEGSIKGSPNKPLPDGNCIEEVTVMKELLNKRLDKITEKKTEKNKELKKQEAEAMLQLLNSAVCAKNQIPKGKIGMESKQRQTFSVRALPSKNKLEKKDLKTGTDKLKISKTDQVNSKKLKETCVHSDSTRHKSSKNQEQKTVQPGKCISVTEIKVKNSSQKQVDSANNKKPRQTEVSLSKRTDHGRIQEVKGQISSKFGYRSRSSSCLQSGQSKAEEERNIGKTIEHEKVKEQMSTKSRSRSSSTSLQSGHSKTVANKTSEQDKAKEQMSVKSRSRSSSTSSQSGLNSKYQPSGSKNIGKTGSKLDTHKPSKKTESGDKGCDKLKTFAEKYEESLKLQQKGDLKKSSKPTATSSKKSAPVIVDKSLPLMTDKSLTQKSPQLEDSNVKNPSNKVRARAYSSSEIENTHGVGEEQMNSAPKKAKLDYTVRDEKSNLWSKANATAPKKTVGVIDEKPQNSEKKLSFKIKPTKSLVKKEPLGVNKGGKRSLKCGKSSSSSSSSSSSAKRSTVDAVKEKRKIKSWVGTNKEKCSIEDVLPGLYSSDKSKLGRIPKITKIPKKGQVSSKPDSASTIVSNNISSSVNSNASTIVHPSSDVIHTDVEMSSAVELPLEVDIAPVQPSTDIIASSVINSSGISFSSEHPNANISQPAVLESVQNATMESIVSRLPAYVEKPSVDSNTHPTDGNIDDADDATEKVLESLVQRSLTSATIEVETEDSLKSEILSENISTDLTLQQTETKVENRLAANIEASENDQHDNLMDESEEMHQNLSCLDQNVMINPVPKLDIMEQSSQSSNASSCSSSKNLTVEKSSSAQEKRRKYLRKREKAESPVDSMMKSIIRSAAAKHRNSPRGWSDNERSRSPGYKSSDSERSNDARYNVKTKNNAEIEKNLQKKFDRDHFNATKIVSSTFLPDVDSNAMCHFASMEITSKAKHMEEQSSEKAVSTEHQKPAVGNRDEEVVVKNQTPSSKRERSIMPDIVIPGLGDLPLSDLNPDSRSSNVLFDPLRLSETPGYSSKKTTQSTKRERSITPEIVIPGLGDLPLKDLYGDSKPSNILYDPLKLSNTAGYERKATPAAKRERSITPEVVIPGLGDLPLPGSRANIPGLSDHLLPNNHADIMGTSESSKTSAEKPLKTSIETESTKVSCDKDISISTDDLLSIPSLDPTGDASSTTALVKDDKSVTKKSTVQEIDADDGEPVVNNTRVVERAGRELKLRVSVPNHLCGDSTVKLITLDQTIRQSLHGHRQFSRLTPTENVLVTTINRVLHKKLYEGKDKRHVEELNGQSIADRLPKKTSNTLTMAELTRNLSPSLVEFARKHLSPTVSDFTRKHDPDVDQEPSDHLSDLMSYESWGVNRNTDNLSSTRDRKPSGKSDNASSKENTSKSKPASPSIPASNLKYVPASAFVPKKGSQIGKSFMNNTKLAVGPDTSSSILDSNLPSKSTTVSPESSSNLSDNVTIRTISIAPKKDSPKTVGCSVTDKTIKEVKAPAIPDKFPSEKDKSKNENSVSTQPETVTSRLSGSASSSSSAKSVKTSSEGPSAPSTKLSENSVLPKPVSASLSSKSMETVSSSPSPARSEESVSSKLSSTKSSKSSLQSTKLSEKKVKSSGSGGALFSPIRIPDGIKSETVNKTLVPESDKTSQVGAIRSDNQLSRKERKAQSHPYTRRRRRESWSFDIPYRNLQELMRDLTANTFKQRIVNISKPQKSKNTVPRFRNYRFRRSSVPDSLPDSPDDSDEFTPDAIPDFEERKRKADMLENMQSSKKEDQEAYTAEQSSYSPGATTVAKPKPDEGKEKGVGGEENIQERLLRISKMPSPAALTTKAKASTNKDTGQGSKEKTALEKIQSESDSSNSNRKRRISQACSPNRRKDSRLSRIRHNTGQGESTHSQPIDDEILSRCRKSSSPSDSVKGGKSSQKNSRESTPFNSSVLKQGSREYSPSEFFCGTGEGKVSRENTPIDFTQDTDISKETQFVVDVPKVEVVQKKKIKIKRLEAGKSPSLSPVSSKVDDCNNPNMFRPITKPDESSGTGDLRDYLQQLKAQKSEHKLESFEISPSAGKSYEKEMPENNIKGCSDSEQTSVSGEQTSKENLVVGEREHTKDGNIFDEDMDGWIVMDEFQCPEASVLKDQAFTKEPVEDKNAPNDPENNINDHATNISEVSVREIDDMRKDLPSSCSGKIQSDTSGTTEKEFDTTDNENQVKNKDILTTSVKEGTKNSEDIISKMNTPTDSERNFIRTDNLCTQSKAEKSEEIHTQSKAEKSEEFRTQPEAEKSEEFLSETNEGDKTIIETSDMSFSETVNDYQFADPSTFVPVIYLSGTKGRKIPWAKELDSSEIGDENVGNDSKEESQPKFKEAHPLKMKELEETCQSKIDKETDVSTEQDNCKSTSEVDDNDVKNTYCSESNPKILSPSELVDANPGQSVLDQTENGPTASQTSKVSTQEQNTCISEGKREDRKNLVEEQVHINTKSAACDETPEHHINTKSAACDETPEHHINTKSAACDETPEHHINTKSAACDETPEHHINTKSAAFDETPENHMNTKSAACDETPEHHINTKSAACDETPEHHINTKSAACDETPEHHINTKSAACDETPEHHINTKSAACDETPEHHINTKSAAYDETPEHHINTKSAACDETPEHHINTKSAACDETPEHHINTKSAACGETPEHHINTKSAACDETPEHHINTKSAACDETPERHINTKSAACDETPEHHINTKSAASDETPEHISAILDTASSETFRPKILLNISGSSTGSENLVTLVSDERCRNDTEDTEDEKVKTENSNVVKTSVDASGNPQHVVTCSRIHSRNVYGYEEENSANTSNGSTRLSCSWDFTVKQDEDSSESIYGEYHTAPKTQTQNSKGDQFTSVLKVEKISDSNNSSCDNLLLEEKTTDNDKDLDCNYSTIITGHGSIKHESETTYSLGPCNIIDVEVQPNVLSGEESVVKVEPTIPNIGSCNTSVEESVIVKVEPTAASIEESTVEVQLYVQSAKECIVKVEPIVPNIKESIMEVQKTVPTADDKTASAVMSICVDGVSDIDCGEESVPSNIGNKEVNLDNTSSNDGNILGINSEEVNIHRKSEEKGNVPCIGAEEEIETNIHDDDDELLQATKTCALLCHGDMFTSVTGREETTSSGQESSQGSTIKCNLSFETEYGEHHDKELMDLGEYCADLTYRLDRDIDLNHDIEVESIISSLEERKDGQDIQVSNGQFDEMKKSDLSLERHQWETLQSKLKPGGGEENFTKLEHCCPEFAMEDSKFEIKINTGNIMKKSTLAVDLNECFNKNDMDLNSSTISLESTSVLEQNKFQKKLMQPLIDRTVEMNTDTNTLLLKKSTGHCQEESIHHNTNSLVAITVDEDIVPDSQDSDSDEVELVNISCFLKPNDSHSYESDVSFHKHITDSHQSQSCDSGELKSRLTEKPHYVEPGVKSMKTSTPRVSPVADFFGLQCQTPVAQFTERPCTDYVYGLYKGKSELESEIPVQSTVEKPCKVDSNAFPLHVQKSPLNLSVSSKPKTSAGIPGMLYYVSPNCSDLADEEVSTGCGVNIKPITSTSGLPTNSNIKLAPPSPLKPKLLCSFEDAHVTVPMVKTEDQGGSSVNVLDTPDQNSSLAEIEAPSLESIPDNTVLPKIEDFRLQQNLIESDGDSTIPYCQESDFDEDSLGSKPSQELNYDNQQSLRPCEIVPEQTESCAQQVDISPTPSSLDVPTSILDSDLIPQPQPAQTITDLDGKNCPSTPMNLSRPSTPLNLSRPSTPLGITSPQRWVVSPPPHYGPNFWPYSPPLGYPPCAYFPYTSPLLQNPINRIWRPPFYYYPDHIPLQQHRIMPSLDPCMFHWTSAARQQLQASSLYPSLMLDSRLPLYSSYTYDRSDTHLGWYDQGTSYDVDSAYPNSNIHTQGNTPSYSNTFMQYVVHGQQVLSHSAVASPPSPPVRPVFLSTTALLSTSRTTTRDQQLMVDTPSAFTPIRPSTAMTNTGLATECVVTPENIPLPDHSPIGQAASTVTRKTELTTDKEVTLANVPLRDPDFSPSPQTSMGSQATLPPISTFAKKSRKSRKSRGKRKK